jgi:hypothetical protein
MEATIDINKKAKDDFDCLMDGCCCFYVQRVSISLPNPMIGPIDQNYH